MSSLVAAEFLKLRTTRTFWWLAFWAVALSALFTVAQLAFDTTDSEADLRTLLSNMTASSILVTILGVVGSAGEYRHGTITSTFLVAPDRLRVQAAKGIAYGLAGVVISAVAAAIVLAIALPWLGEQGESVSGLGLGGGELAGILAGALATGFISGVFGVGLGSLIANQLGAVMILVVLIFILDPALAAIFQSYTQFSFSGLTTALSGTRPEDTGLDGEIFSATVSGLIYAGYAAVLLGAAAVAARYRDVA